MQTVWCHMVFCLLSPFYLKVSCSFYFLSPTKLSTPASMTSVLFRTFRTLDICSAVQLCTHNGGFVPICFVSSRKGCSRRLGRWVRLRRAWVAFFALILWYFSWRRGCPSQWYTALIGASSIPAAGHTLVNPSEHTTWGKCSYPFYTRVETEAKVMCSWEVAWNQVLWCPDPSSQSPASPR